jgi:hypothetical protein
MARTRKKMEKEYGAACSIQKFRATYPPCMKQKTLENTKEYKQRINRCILTKKSALQYFDNSKGPFTYNRSTRKKCVAAQRAFLKKYGKEYLRAEEQCSKKMIKIMNEVMNGNKKSLTPCTHAQLIEYNKTMKPFRDIPKTKRMKRTKQEISNNFNKAINAALKNVKNQN